MEFDFDQIATRAKERYALSLDGIHGLAHWQRVQENGLELAKHSGADVGIVQLFSFLHDCCREDDHADPEHGPRAAEFTKSLRGELIVAPDDKFETLLAAIHDHTHGLHSSDETIGTCWDADRLDIGRVGVKPHPRYLSTAIAKEDRILRWAYERSVRP